MTISLILFRFGYFLDHFIVFSFMCVCSHVCTCMGKVHIHICGYTCGDLKSMLSVFLNHFPPYFLDRSRYVVLTDLEFTM